MKLLNKLLCMFISYKRELKNIHKYFPIPEAEFFIIKGKPDEVEFTDTFKFYKRLLLEWGPKYDVKDSYLFFRDGSSRNAKASVHNGRGIIAINHSLVYFQIYNFKRKTELHDHLAARFTTILPFLDNPINVLLFQLIQHSTFYHEFAHLIQRSEELQTGLAESYEDGGFSSRKHKLEYDADSFSALSMAAHVQQYGFKIFGDELDQNKMELLVELFSTAALLYFFSFEGARQDIYYESGTHPHPIIRILNVLLIISDYLNKSPKLTAIGININPKTILPRVIALSYEIESVVLEIEDSIDLRMVFTEHTRDILSYFTKLNEYPIDGYRSAVSIWNDKATK